MLEIMVRKEFLKQGSPTALSYECAGITWLAQAGGANMVKILGLDGRGLHLQYLESGFENETAAREFGSALAFTHAGGAPGWGAAPPTWNSTKANKGLLPMSVVPPGEPFKYQSFGEWLVEQRLEPTVQVAAKHGDMPLDTVTAFEKLYRLLSQGEFDTPQPQLVKTPAARLHGDLWAGNLQWTRTGVVLIDPSAYGGHAETDLAECELFTTPYVKEIYAGYQSVSPLAPGWEQRLRLHQLYMLTLHLALFGKGYLGSVKRAVSAYL